VHLSVQAVSQVNSRGLIAIEQVRRIILILSPHEPRLLHQGPRVSEPPGLALAAYSISNTAAGPASSNSSNLICNYLIACLATRLLCCHSLGLCAPRRCQPSGVALITPLWEWCCVFLVLRRERGYWLGHHVSAISIY
jgi:hypothetical protein